MINSEKSFNIHDYIEIFLRRIWYIIIPFIVIIIGAVLYAYYTPKEYRATTLILVTPQKVPEAFVRATVTSRIEDRLQSIGQEIMSRTRLEQVISEFQLYREESKAKPLEEVVGLMRKDIRVEIKGPEGYFTISYIGKEPRIVTMVTNKLSSLFIEENLRQREQQAQGTSEFLSFELNATKTKLEEQEKAVTHFKRQFMGELPEQREANLRVLEQLQLQYQRNGESLRSAEDRKMILHKQLSDAELLIVSAGSNLPSSPLETRTQLRNETRDPQEVQLEQLRNQLLDLKAKYTEKHPDIVIVKKKIADLEAKIEKSEPSSTIMASQSTTSAVETRNETRRERPDPRLNLRYQEMESQLVSTELEIKRLKEEDAKVKAQINQYRERIENTPAREQSMTFLTRDYENTKASYESLLNKSLEAQQAENLERRQKGEQFKVIDPARTPEKPYKPDIRKILLIGLLLGIGSGFGMAFLKEQMDHSFRDADDLETNLGFKVLANIPRIEKKAA